MNGDSLGGQVLCGRYRVEETLKPGGMARVYKVVDTTSNRTLALKFPTSSSNEALAILAFDREREALENLQHPSIVELVDAGRTEQQELYLALEWLPTCLNEQLTAGNRWNWEDFYADVGAPLISALAAAHRRDIAHRDIKPENLRFDEFGRLKVTDFGIAKARSGVQIGETFKAAGSPPYTPPEVDDGTNSYARDSFSWATVALACLSGRTFANLLRENHPTYLDWKIDAWSVNECSALVGRTLPSLEAAEQAIYDFYARRDGIHPVGNSSRPSGRPRKRKAAEAYFLAQAER